MGNFYDIFDDPDSGSDAIATALGLPLEGLMGGGRSREEIISGLILLITALGAEASEAEMRRINRMLFVNFGSLFLGGLPGGEGTQ